MIALVLLLSMIRNHDRPKTQLNRKQFNTVYYDFCEISLLYLNIHYQHFCNSAIWLDNATSNSFWSLVDCGNSEGPLTLRLTPPPGLLPSGIPQQEKHFISISESPALSLW